MAHDRKECSVALLRGINVGGKNILPMATLRNIFTAAGCTQVATYIQSGNVIFMPPSEVDVAAVVKAEIAQLGLHVPVLLRSSSGMQRAIADNPFLKTGVDTDLLHVMFLEDEPSGEQLAALDHTRSAPDKFAVIGREVYLHLPSGVARTKLTNAWFDARLKTVGTQRNWRTVKTLAQMMGDSEAR